MLGWWFVDPKKWVAGEWREREDGRFGSDYPRGFRSCASIPVALDYIRGGEDHVAQIEHGGCISKGTGEEKEVRWDVRYTESCRARLVVAWEWTLGDSMSLVLNAADRYLNLCAPDNPRYPHISRALGAANDLLRNPSESLLRETLSFARTLMPVAPMGYYVAAAAVHVVSEVTGWATDSAKNATRCCADAFPSDAVYQTLHKRVLARLMLREPIGVGDVSVG